MKHFIALLAIVISLPVYSVQLSEIASGHPNSFALPESVYTEVKTLRLKNAKVLWFNFELAREMGVEIPKEGLTPDFERKILDAFAYNAPHENIGLENFTNLSKTFYADRYGGLGLGVNWGAGRAASAGQFQIKGIGQTSLVGTGQSFDHAHGGASIKESINEAIWGEVASRELPHGANRVLAIIDSGTFTHWKDGGKEARALIVRQDALRPAHFIDVLYGRGEKNMTALDLMRVKESLEKLPELLPHSGNGNFAGLSKSEKLKQGFLKLAENWAEQFAAAYSRRILHGATSPSNIELGGRFLDYGTMTALSGFDGAKILAHAEAFGEEISNGHSQTLATLFDTVEKYGSNSLKAAMPDKVEIIAKLILGFEYHKGLELAELTGLPKHLIKIEASTKEFQEFVVILNKLTLKIEETLVDKVMPKMLGRYDVPKIMLELAANAIYSPEKISKALLGYIPEEKMRMELAQKFKALYKNCELQALKDGVRVESFHTLVQESSALRNTNLEELYRPQLLEKNVQMIDNFKMHQDRSLIWDHIDSVVKKSRRTYPNLAPYETCLGSRVNLLDQSTSLVTFDAKLGKYIFHQELMIEGGAVQFFGNKVPLSILRRGMVRATSNLWKDSLEVPLEIKNKKAIFRLPLESSAENVEFILRDESAQHWWKSGNKNIHFRLVRTISGSHGCWKAIDLILNAL